MSAELPVSAKRLAGASGPCIRVREARTHNLKGLDVDLPQHRLVAICGVSGSGKSSLAIDTIYAEGQRRYIESFSTFARQFMERLARPPVESIDGLPPPICIREAPRPPGRRATVGTASQVYDHLRLLFARLGQVICPECHLVVACDQLEEVAENLATVPHGRRLLVTFAARTSGDENASDFWSRLAMLGFRRIILEEELVSIDAASATERPSDGATDVVVDRLVAGRTPADRMIESLETARDQGQGPCAVYVEADSGVSEVLNSFDPRPVKLDGRSFFRCTVTDTYACRRCGRDFVEPSPQLFSFHSPLGACPECEGLGLVRGGGSTTGPHRWHACSTCLGKRLRPEALAVQVGGASIAELCDLTAARLVESLANLPLSDSQRELAAPLLAEMQARLGSLIQLGLGHLPISRPGRMLSRGELGRVALAHALNCSIEGALYVLDEPMTGLHPADIERASHALARLRDRGNTVMVVEHHAEILRAADFLVELGPGAGDEGGRVVFEGTPEQILEAERSLTGGWLTGRRGAAGPPSPRPASQGRIRLLGATAKNLQALDVEFPLGVLCVVTGVSGAGKTALVQDCLFPAMRKELGRPTGLPGAWRAIDAPGQIEHVELVDRSQPSRTARSSTVTYVKAFDAIRQVFAETIDAKTHNYSAGFFSFNVEGGRCEWCKGEGLLKVDMQFLPDLHVTCPECGGRRYRPAALAVQYRNRSIADVLEMTAAEAIPFFRGKQGVQSRLQCLKEVGLDYLRLGQRVSTLSGGETQRLKLAPFLHAKRGGRTLFLCDEPTAGLHALDVLKLLDCFDALLAVGHSLVVVSHDLQLIRAADYVIELGPGAGGQGGRLVASGTPEQIGACPDAVTGRYL